MVDGGKRVKVAVLERSEAVFVLVVVVVLLISDVDELAKAIFLVIVVFAEVAIGPLWWWWWWWCRVGRRDRVQTVVPVVDCAGTGIIEPIEFAPPYAIVVDESSEFRVCEGELREVGHGEEVHDDDPGFDGEAADEGTGGGGGDAGSVAVWHEGGPSLCVVRGRGQCCKSVDEREMGD